MTWEALEAQFWFPAGADQVRMLKAFADGRRSFIAVAEGKVRSRPGQVVRLTANDFLIKPCVAAGGGNSGAGRPLAVTVRVASSVTGQSGVFSSVSRCWRWSRRCRY
ncbi:hypothetical protein E2553_42170 [Paraburkholderia dipogonis]|uniref:Uncharacterized protein n=1 Tax=Paraburkholderia dipogonis TaxID=1211383 RepID=A0A4Y8MHQ9_9BURK|nr:hypothetical protein E2553_42170 [Paraburkholderia dipogonis]